jgi:hypothetical protein
LNGTRRNAKARSIPEENGRYLGARTWREGAEASHAVYDRQCPRKSEALPLGSDRGHNNQIQNLEQPMPREKVEGQLLIPKSRMRWFMAFVLVLILPLSVPKLAFAQQKLREAHEIGKIYGRIHTNAAILAGIVTNCESIPGPQGEFFSGYKGKLADIYPTVGGLIKGIQSRLMVKRLGKVVSAQIEQMNHQYMTAGNVMVNQWFSSADSSDRPRACKNFEDSIRQGDWDIFPLADQYFDALKHYDADIYKRNRWVQELIERKRALHKGIEGK